MQRMQFGGTEAQRVAVTQGAIDLGALRPIQSAHLIPIPGSIKGVSQRGYNHSAVIAHTIVESAKNDELKLSVREDVLYKKKEVQQQAKTESRRERSQNVENIFAVKHGDQLFEKTLILIDDVITTGATVADAKRALKVFKPKRILAISVAH